METSEIRFWPGVPDFAALGARELADLMGTGGALEEERQLEVVHDDRAAGEGRKLLRYPLPGTITKFGGKYTPPRGAGTGFVYLARWHGGSLREKAAARLTHPRSSSFAARAWNLFCHLREHGVGTAQPLAMASEAAALFASHSCLVTRELANMQSLPDYLREHPGYDARRRLALALGLFLARIAEAKVRLPRLKLDSIFVARRAGAGVCGKEGQGAGPSPVPGVERRGLPELALATVTGGQILESYGGEESVRVFLRLAQQFESLEPLHAKLALRVLRHACGPSATREERKRLARAVLSFASVKKT